SYHGTTSGSSTVGGCASCTSTKRTYPTGTRSSTTRRLSCCTANGVISPGTTPPLTVITHLTHGIGSSRNCPTPLYAPVRRSDATFERCGPVRRTEEPRVG